MRRNVWGAVAVTVAALGGLGLIGYQVYQAGYRAGLVEDGSEVVVRGFDGPGFFGFFPLFGILFFFLFVGFIARLAFGRPWRGPYRDWYPEEGSSMDRRLGEWHERAHESGGRAYRSESEGEHVNRRE